MSLEHQAKPALRQQLRERRQHLAPAFRAQAATAAAALAPGLPGWLNTRHIAMYWPGDGELDPLPLADACREQRRALYLPVLAPGKRLLFRRWQVATNLVPNRFGIPEPDADSPHRAAAGMDIIFLPLVGWRRDGYRLGMGGGFYDRTLGGVDRPLRVGLGFDCQEIVGGPAAEPWDVGLDYVLTETALHRCERAASA
ncbi:MAG: 5-formyltetrahydrofolate cyclo-ligase [Haliea sp.]|uniref:5-formyltetrahydrofolate cyclo-ligase n=1 Tax=Haliea sp. TaxID=1932666 RepID=UPI0032EDC522